ncbi:hypothetical protein [Pseudomonas sp. P8_241]|uniref:type IV pilus assembly protein FimV n=1 Tax=Pseudomonas sp. P8_241 TaxID=3043445 RepID=UPI002A3647E9|nr:hypothetical protein [Pseudomonas sp. P8_241]WPN48711.1 hypothetical protein QMK58_08600 [Pseudomonas sp. P8_241]
MLKRWRLVLCSCSRVMLALAAVTYPALAPALGLGDIALHSALNQPLRAEITLVDVAGLEEGELSATLATADEFRRAGVDRAVFLDNLTFTPVLRGNRRLIQVTSSKPVNEPFLNFLVQVNQTNGRLVREYTLLIDPPGSPEIVPATDEPVFSPSSAFPSVQPAVVAPPAPVQPSLKSESVQSASAPDAVPAAEQLAASILQNRQLQITVDELNAKLRGQDKEISVQQKQLAQLQSRLVALKSAQAEPVSPALEVVEESDTDWLQAARLPLLAVLLVLGWLLLRQRRLSRSEPSTEQPSEAESMVDLRGADRAMQSACAQHGEIPVDQEHMLQDAPARYPQLAYFAPVVDTTMAAAAPPEDVPEEPYRLEPEDLSMNSSWELINPYESARPAALNEIEATMEWVLEPDSQPRDDPKRTARNQQAGLS